MFDPHSTSTAANSASAEVTPAPISTRRSSVFAIARILLSARCLDEGRPLERLEDLEPERQKPYLRVAILAFKSLDLPAVEQAFIEAAHALDEAESLTDAPQRIDVQSLRGTELLARARHTIHAYLNFLARS